ncbi:MAG: lysylphosphatidylglycerol synthase transmembrane domain-containing protein [Candidatus Zixiibacteriota bacterium]
MILNKKQFWGTLIAIALLAYCVKDVRLSELETMLQRANYLYLIPATIFAFVFIVLKGLRWKLMLSQHRKIPVVRAVTLYSAGQILNVVMPMLTGQVGRMFLFAKKEGLRKTFVFSTIVLEILFDAISLLIFLFLTSIAFAVPEGYRAISPILMSVTLVLLVLLYLLLHFQRQMENLGHKYFRPRWPSIYIGVKKFIRSFTKGIEMLRSSQHLFGSLFYSLGSWAAHILVVYFLLRSLDLQLPFAAAAAIVIINTLAVMVPITPGNAGTFEVVVIGSLAAFGVGRSEAMLLALALHLLDFVPIFAMGYAFLHQERISISEIRKVPRDSRVLNVLGEDGAYVEYEEGA